jgi:hypothetical protein
VLRSKRPNSHIISNLFMAAFEIEKVIQAAKTSSNYKNGLAYSRSI